MSESGYWRAEGIDSAGRHHECWCPPHQTEQEARECARENISSPDKAVVYYPPMKGKIGRSDLRLGYYTRI